MTSGNNSRFTRLLQMLFTPAILIILGLILIVNPDSATAMVGRILGWALTLAGAVAAIFAGTSREGRLTKAIPAVILLLAGIWLLKTPLSLAAALGRVIGILVAVRGVQDIRNATQWGFGMPMAIVTTLIGVILVALPLTSSRLVMMACGGLVLFTGGAELMERLRRSGKSESDDDNIIDAL